MSSNAKYPPRRYLTAEERKREILEVAVPIFIEKGYERAEMAEIASQAGVSRSLLNRHFGDKRQLLVEAIQFASDVDTEGLEMDPGIDLETRIARNTELWLDHFEQNLLGVGMAYLPIVSDPSLMDVIDRIRNDIIDRILQNYVGTSDVPEIVKVSLRGYISLCLTICNEWLQEKRATREQVAEIMRNQLLALVTETIPALVDETRSSK